MRTLISHNESYVLSYFEDRRENNQQQKSFECMAFRDEIENVVYLYFPDRVNIPKNLMEVAISVTEVDLDGNSVTLLQLLLNKSDQIVPTLCDFGLDAKYA